MADIRTEQSNDLHGKVIRIDGFINNEMTYTFFINPDTKEISAIRKPMAASPAEENCLDLCRLSIFRIINPEAYNLNG